MAVGSGLEGVLAGLNVSGWRAESAHGCDGTEEGCMATCPIQVQVEVSSTEIAAAIAAHLEAVAGDAAVREAVTRAIGATTVETTVGVAAVAAFIEAVTE